MICGIVVHHDALHCVCFVLRCIVRAVVPVVSHYKLECDSPRPSQLAHPHSHSSSLSCYLTYPLTHSGRYQCASVSTTHPIPFHSPTPLLFPFNRITADIIHRITANHIYRIPGVGGLHHFSEQISFAIVRVTDALTDYLAGTTLLIIVIMMILKK